MIFAILTTETSQNEFTVSSYHDTNEINSQLIEKYGDIPISFEENQGQTNEQVKYLSRGNGYTLFLTPTEAVLTLSKPFPNENSDIQNISENTVLRIKTINSNPNPTVIGLEEISSKSNYLFGNDPNTWIVNVPHYSKVLYQDVYPGINMEYYGSQGELEYDFVVSPGANPQLIRLDFEGADQISLDDKNNLIVHTPAGKVIQYVPNMYQNIDGVIQSVLGKYQIFDNGELGFEINSYNANMPLVIDPVLSYSTYLGGTGEELAFGIAVDSSGNAYIAGETISLNFPTVNPIQASISSFSGADAFVTKINAVGNTIVYSTYLGGSLFDSASGIAVDSSGNAYITGYTESPDYPTVNPIQTYQGSPASATDSFVTKINAAGDALVYSTYLGGSRIDQAIGIDVDSSGNAYIIGVTDSTDYPAVNPIQASMVGVDVPDAFVTKINAAGDALVYSTNLGGSLRDVAFDIVVDSSGNAYIAGETQSLNFPTVNPIQASFAGLTDAFVTKINAAGDALVYSTYLGGSNGDQAFGIAVDSSGNAYLTGDTQSLNFPTVNPIQASISSFSGNPDAFVTKINAAGDAFVYSTYLGGSSFDRGIGIGVDSLGDAYIAGETQSLNFPTVNPIQTSLNGLDGDAFVTKINATGDAFVYSTYLGGSLNERVFKMVTDSSGNAYITGFTTSPDYPTEIPIQSILLGPNDGFITKICDTTFCPSTLKITKLTTGGDDIFDFTVTGPTSYNPSINTADGGGPITHVAPNFGSDGSSADGKYFENNVQVNFNVVPGIINDAVLQEGTDSSQDQGEIRFGTNSQWDFLHTFSGSNTSSINLWVKGDLECAGDPACNTTSTFFTILSTMNEADGDTDGIMLYERDDEIYIDTFESGNPIDASTNLNIGGVPNDGQWHMITLAIDRDNLGSEYFACIDPTPGVPFPTGCSLEAQDQPFAGGGGNSGKPLTVGGVHFDPANGATENSFEVDDVTIWHGYKLSSADVLSLYNAGVGSSAGVTGLNIATSFQVLHVPFDDITGGGMGMDGPNPVVSGTYSIQETIPAGWNLITATCNDGLSSFSVDTVSDIVIDPGDNIECTFENELSSSPDTDSDGIFNEVDTFPGIFSNDFSDLSLGGTSSGTITTRGNQILTITEETNPSGVRISADISGGLIPAVVNACGGISLIKISPGDKIVVTCGSVTIDVINGPVDITFTSSGGTQATTSLTSGNSITFDQDTFSFVAPSTNVDSVVVIVEGEQITINPGQAVSVLSSNKDSFLKQGESNTNEGINTMMRVRDSGNNRALMTFDQNEILTAAQGNTLQSATLRLYIEENGNNWGPNGGTVDVHRLLSNWSEGNGFNDKPASMTLSQFNALKTRGNGPGVTWKCATDTEINNQQTNCSPLWNGASFNLTPTATITIFKDNPPTGTVKTVGWIEFDVTSDLQTFLSNTEQNFGWIVKKTQEGAPGLVEFTSDEGTANTPELVLVFG